VGVVAAGDAAREAGGPNDDLPIGLHFDRLFEQSLVDRAQLLHREITVVDPAPTIVAADLARKRVQRRCDDGVAERDPRKDVVLSILKQSTVVGRQADTRLAHGDGAEQVAQMLPVAPHRCREGVVAVDTVGDLLPHPAQRVVVVAPVARREQVAIFGEQDEEQPVEQDQGCTLDVFPVVAFQWPSLRICGHQGGNKARKDVREHPVTLRCGHPAFPMSAFVQRDPVERTALRVPGLRQESGSPEREEEDAQCVGRVRGRRQQIALQAPGAREVGEIEFQELFRPRPCALPVEPPVAAVGEDAPHD